jgi:CBS domain-containing membrane protein
MSESVVALQPQSLPKSPTVGDIMSPVVHVGRQSDLIREVHSLMRASRIRHMPILDEHGALCGVVSDRDLMLGWCRGAAGRVSEVMSRHVQWVHPATSAREAAGRLLTRKIGCLPVVNHKLKLVGIVTETDFLELALRALSAPEKGDGR